MYQYSIKCVVPRSAKICTLLSSHSIDLLSLYSKFEKLDRKQIDKQEKAINEVLQCMIFFFFFFYNRSMKNIKRI